MTDEIDNAVMAHAFASDLQRQLDAERAKIGSGVRRLTYLIAAVDRGERVDRLDLSGIRDVLMGVVKE